MVGRWTLAVVFAAATGVGVMAADWPQWRGPHGTGTTSETTCRCDGAPRERRVEGAYRGLRRLVADRRRAIASSSRRSSARACASDGNHPRLVAGRRRGRGRRARARPRAARWTAARSSSSKPSTAPTAGVVGIPPGRGRVRCPACTTSTTLRRPSPVTDGARVYAWFGTGQIVALDMNGKRSGSAISGKEIAPFDVNWGHGSSPTLFGDTVILLCDHEPAAYLLAVDKRTGKRALEGRSRQGPDVLQHAARRDAATGPS